MKTSAILKTSSVNIVLKFAAVGMVFLFQALLAKTVSVESYSIYAKFTMYSGYISLLTSFGMTSSLLYISKTENNFIKNYLGVFLFYLFVGLITIGVVALINHESLFYILIVIFSILMNLVGISLSFYQYQKNFTKYAIFGFYQSLSVISVLFFINIFNLTDMIDVLKIYIATHILFFIVLLFNIYLDHIGSFFSKPILNMQNFIYGLKTVGLMLLAQFIYITDFVMVDYFLESTSLAYYFVALILSKVIFIMADTVGSIVFTLYTQASRGEKKDVDQSVYIVSSLLFSMSLIVLVVFVFFGKSFLIFVYDDAYVNAYLATLILIAGTQGMIIYKFLSRKLAAENSWKILYSTVLFAAILNVVLNIILIPNYGIEGAAISSFIAYWACGISLVILHKERLSNFLFRTNSRRVINNE